jgi:hypothetical protein
LTPSITPCSCKDDNGASASSVVPWVCNAGSGVAAGNSTSWHCFGLIPCSGEREGGIMRVNATTWWELAQVGGSATIGDLTTSRRSREVGVRQRGEMQSGGSTTNINGTTSPGEQEVNGRWEAKAKASATQWRCRRGWGTGERWKGTLGAVEICLPSAARSPIVSSHFSLFCLMVDCWCWRIREELREGFCTLSHQCSYVFRNKRLCTCRKHI